MRWFIAALIVLGAFLPCLTVKSRRARSVFGLIAAGLGVVYLYFFGLASAPDAGIVGFVWGALASIAALGLYALFFTGVGIGVSRFLAPRVKLPSGPVLAGTVIVVFVLAFGVPYGVGRWQAASTYAASNTDVLSARDAAGPQTQHELERRVLALLAPDAQQEAPLTTSQALVRMWHPGVAKNNWATTSFVGDHEMPYYDTLPGIVANQLVSYYKLTVQGDAPNSGTMHLLEPADTLTATWSGPVSLRTIVERDAWDGRNLKLRDGRLLFPSGTFWQLDLSRHRDGRSEPFLTFYAVDDAGKWWLVGAVNPYLAAASGLAGGWRAQGVDVRDARGTAHRAQVMLEFSVDGGVSATASDPDGTVISEGQGKWTLSPDNSVVEVSTSVGTWTMRVSSKELRSSSAVWRKGVGGP